MRAEVLAVGTELLLGQITNSNAAWLGEQLALAGIDCHHHTVVGDNHARIVAAMRACLARADAVIVCGGLGPTQDDITREAIAEVMGVELQRDEEIVERIRKMFASRSREMPESNARQGDVPAGASVIEQRLGTAPGLICPVGANKVAYLVPGVPYEMEEMFARAVLPDLQARAVAAGEEPATIRSRVLRTWGMSESAVAEAVAPRVEALEEAGKVTLAFLASGAEGIKVRITAKAPDAESAEALLEEEAEQLRGILGGHVFGVDEQGIEDVVGRLLEDKGWHIAVAESATGGMVASRLVDVPGSSNWFTGGVVAYDSRIKFEVLGVREGPVVCAEAAEQMARGVAEKMGTEVGLATTGEAGPEPSEDVPVGTVFVGLHIDGKTESVELHLPGDRARIRSLGTISALDALRRRLQG